MVHSNGRSYFVQIVLLFLYKEKSNQRLKRYQSKTRLPMIHKELREKTNKDIFHLYIYLHPTSLWTERSPLVGKPALPPVLLEVGTFCSSPIVADPVVPPVFAGRQTFRLRTFQPTNISALNILHHYNLHYEQY